MPSLRSWPWGTGVTGRCSWRSMRMRVNWAGSRRNCSARSARTSGYGASFRPKTPSRHCTAPGSGRKGPPLSWSMTRSPTKLGPRFSAQQGLLHPNARRALLVAWGAWAHPESAQKILRSIAVGDISYYVLKPWTTPDELFHRAIAEFVQEWSRSEPANLREVVVVAAQHTGRAYAVSDLMSRNGIPHAFRPRASELGQSVLAEIGHPEGEVVVWMPAIGGTCLVDPTDAEILEAWGIPTDVAGCRSAL